MAAFGWLAGTTSIRVWQVFVFAFAAGCVQVFDTPARQALALTAQCASALGAFGAGILIPLRLCSADGPANRAGD
jgi:hypothetical protein